MLALSAGQRDEPLRMYREAPDPGLRFRARIIRLPGEGRPWPGIQRLLFRSSRTIDRWLKRSEAEAAEGLAGRRRGRPLRPGAGWAAVLVGWVTSSSTWTACAAGSAGTGRPT